MEVVDKMVKISDKAEMIILSTNMVLGVLYQEVW